MHICTIESCIHERVNEHLIILPEDGFYNLEVHVEEEHLATEKDPKGFVQHAIAEHLAGCVASTKLPLKEGLWLVKFTEEAQKAFNFPEGFIA